jgi:hypothetical protein
LDIPHHRLRNQHISGAAFEKPGEAVKWMGAVQAQDYLGALWAVGLRTENATREVIEKAIAEKTIVRTWPMRRTLHFVAAEDARWMLELLTPRIVAGSAGRLHRHLGLDEATFARSKRLFIRALEGGRQLARGAMYGLLERANISTEGGRGLHILCRLAQDGVICFGAREGKQPTFALLEEWAPGARTMARDEALAELAGRYFTSHGPAKLQDFVWWSGLTVADARAAIKMAGPRIAEETIDGQTYWLPSSAPPVKRGALASYLLPPFDEYTVAYKDRSAVLDPSYTRRINPGNGVFSPTIVMDGRIAGIWKREIRKGELIISPEPFSRLTAPEMRALAAAASRYGRFIGAPLAL